MLGLQLLKKLGAKITIVQGDSELIIKQVKWEYVAKHPRLRAYRNAVHHLLDTFVEYDLAVIPRTQNVIVDSLDVSARNFKITHPNKPHTIEIENCPVVPDNMRY